MRVTILASGVFFGALLCGLADEATAKSPICRIGMQTEPRTGGYPLVCIEGVPYFEMGRDRRSDDAPAPWPWKSRVECGYFEFQSLSGETTIRSLGAGEFDEGFTKFIPDEKLAESERPPVGYLTADY